MWDIDEIILLLESCSFVNYIWGTFCWSLLNYVAYVLTCQCALRAYVLRANLSCVLTWSRINVPCMLTCQRTLRAYVLTCQHALLAYVFICQRVFRVYVLTFSRPASFACSRARAITTNNKDKVSIACFPDIFVIVLWFFFQWNKTAVHFCISLTSQKSLTGAMTNFVQWNGLIFVWA